ncbi:hypothetical protein D3C71_1779600 [compost metagenome]
MQLDIVNILVNSGLDKGWKRIRCIFLIKGHPRDPVRITNNGKQPISTITQQVGGDGGELFQIDPLRNPAIRP